MKQFTYTIKGPLCIRARHTGSLPKTAKSFDDTAIIIAKSSNSVKATQLISLNDLIENRSNEVIVAADGPAEDEIIIAILKIFEGSL